MHYGVGLVEDRDGDLSPPKPDRLAAIAHVQVDLASSDFRAGVRHNVNAAPPLVQPRDPDLRAKRQNGRIGRDRFVSRARTGRRDRSRAVSRCGERRATGGRSCWRRCAGGRCGWTKAPRTHLRRAPQRSITAHPNASCVRAFALPDHNIFKRTSLPEWSRPRRLRLSLRLPAR